MNNPKYLYWVLPLFIVPLLLVYGYFSFAKKEGGAIKSLEAFTLSDENSQSFSLENLKERVNVISFVFTSCQGQCPMIIHQTKKLLTQFRGSPKIQMVSITVDPETDTPQVLKKYKTKNDIENRHVFLTGTLKEVKKVVEKNFLVSGEKNSDEISHSTNFILVDEKANIVGYYDAFNKQDFEKLSEKLSQLLKK